MKDFNAIKHGQYVFEAFKTKVDEPKGYPTVLPENTVSFQLLQRCNLIAVSVI